MKQKFYKIEGAGNDFVFIDDRSLAFPLKKQLVQHLCHRRYGIGSDGLVVMRPSSLADCHMVYFNADGSEASFCGNALRCTALALRACGHGAQEEFLVETAKGVMRCTLRGEQIETTFPTPALLFRFAPVVGKDMSFFVVDTGVPHAVAIVEDLASIDVHSLGRKVRYHPQLGDQGANVTFAKILGPDKVSIRTYERGVEGETLSCGSGAVAAAYIIAKQQKSSRLSVNTRGEDQFEIDTVNWFLTGPARLAFEGEIDIST